jgi:hypothetical protein
LWILWTHFDSRRVYTEKEVNAVLIAANAFSDPVHAAARADRSPAAHPQERRLRVTGSFRPAGRGDAGAARGMARAPAHARPHRASVTHFLTTG